MEKQSQPQFSKKPLQLISFTKDNKLKCHKESLQFIQSNLQSPFALISFIGPIRQGKSLLLNYFSGRLAKDIDPDLRFKMSNGVESYTHGVYINPDPIKKNGIHYYFIDCQGKENKKEEDEKIYSLVFLISSLCIFQSSKTITYDHDFLLPYLKSRLYVNKKIDQKEIFDELLLINPNMRISFLVRDCPPKKVKEVKELFSKVFLVDEKISSSNENNDSRKQNQADMRNIVRKMLREDFKLDNDSLYTLPYYLDKMEDKYDWENYNEDISSDDLCEEFKTKADEFLDNHIVKKAKALVYLDYYNNKANFLKNVDFAALIEIYVKLINEGKLDNLFQDINTILSNTKEQIFEKYNSSIDAIFEDNEITANITKEAELKDYYTKKFNKLNKLLLEDIENHGKIKGIKIPNLKIESWINEFDQQFLQKLNKKIEIFKKDLDIIRLQNEVEIKENLQKETLKKLEDEKQKVEELINKEAREKNQNECSSFLEEKKEIPHNTTIPIIANNPIIPAQQHYIDNDFDFDYSYLGHNTSSNHIPSYLPKRNDGGLDMRYSVNKSYVSNSMSVPLKKNGTPDMRYSVNKALFGRRR